jgi:hypothetical protein
MLKAALGLTTPEEVFGATMEDFRPESLTAD